MVEGFRKEPARRGLRYLIVILLVLVITATPAWAKLPPFTVTVEPKPPVAREPTTISAEFEASFPVEELPGLLVLHRAADQREHGERIAITLERIDSIRYEATVVIPEAGSWVLKAFPDRTGWSTQETPPGYPDTIELEVVAPPVAASSPSQSTVGQIRFDLALVMLLSMVGLRFLLNHRRSPFEGIV